MNLNNNMPPRNLAAAVAVASTASHSATRGAKGRGRRGYKPSKALRGTGKQGFELTCRKRWRL